MESDNRTGINLVKYFQDYSKTKNKIFVASPLDTQVADSIINHFRMENKSVPFIKQCIDFYIDTHKDIGVSINNFALHLGDIKNVILSYEEERRNFKKTLEETRIIMEDLE